MHARFGSALLLVALFAIPVRAQDAQAVEHFERKIRPLFATHCLECHGADAANIKSGLRITSRAEILKGGQRGPAVVPGDPDKSRLIRAIR